MRKPIIGIPADRRLLNSHWFHCVGEKYINAVVLASEARSRTPANAMAAARGERGSRKYGIFVYFESVRRTLGYQGHDLSPRQMWELSRALARIVAHEVVHALAPARGHADSGLMTERLTRNLLLADRIELDESSLALVVAAMQEWQFPARTSAQPAFRTIFVPEVPFLWPSVR